MSNRMVDAALTINDHQIAPIAPGQQVAETTGADSSRRSPLADLQAFIAALRIKAQVAQTAGLSTASVSDLPMAAVFDPAIKPREGLSTDRDSTKRDENIVSVLKERGALRVLGAIASPSLANAISQLYESHANFSAAIDYVLGEEILARQRGEALCGLRLLLHGGAGVGKTDFSLTLAELLDVPAEVLSFSPHRLLPIWLVLTNTGVKRNRVLFGSS